MVFFLLQAHSCPECDKEVFPNGEELYLTRQTAKTTDQLKEIFAAESFHCPACESRMPIMDAKRKYIHSVHQPSMFSEGSDTFITFLKAIVINM